MFNTAALEQYAANTMVNVKLAIRIAAFPLSVLALSLAFIGVYRALGLPPSDQLVRMADSLMERYGYAIVFVGAFLEATPVVNVYLPGSTVVILAVAFSRRGTLNVFVVLAVATAAFLLAYAFDYAIGRFGWHALIRRLGFGSPLDRARDSILRRGTKWLWLGYVHPNVGALAATASGILRVPFGRFALLSAGAVTCWDAAWGAAAFFGAGIILRFLDMRWLIPFVIAWVIYALVRGMRRGRGKY
ncbi:MAG TPA: hypothetical protein VM221_02390 [Armatimonadota bacterium]|nr:hypothetical protein [Armatimonadota bacterium]